MRRLFIVLAKLTGLFLVYRLLISLVHYGFVIRAMVTGSGSEGVMMGIVYTLAHIFLPAVMIWLLLTRTNWIADKLKIENDNATVVLQEKILLRCGIKLIGLFVVVYGLSQLSNSALQLWWYRHYGEQLVS